MMIKYYLLTCVNIKYSIAYRLLFVHNSLTNDNILYNFGNTAVITVITNIN